MISPTVPEVPTIVTLLVVNFTPPSIEIVPPTDTFEVKVETPETLSCLVNNVGPVTVVIPANVETPETLKVSREVFPLTVRALVGFVVPIPTLESV